MTNHVNLVMTPDNLDVQDIHAIRKASRPGVNTEVVIYRDMSEMLLSPPPIPYRLNQASICEKSLREQEKI
jgi:hypothetical protein